MNHFNFPDINPFRLVKILPTASIHMGEDWFCKQVRRWEMSKRYFQKWKRSEITKIQCECSIVPNPVFIYNRLGIVVQAPLWTQVFAGIGYSIYEVTINLSTFPEGVYFLYQKVEFATDVEAISEPIWSKDSWPSTLLFKYKHRFNDYGVAFSATGIEFLFRVEGDIYNFTPERDRRDFVNQRFASRTLKATAWKSFKLHIGGTDQDDGVAPWVIDLMNRIMICSSINISGKYYDSVTGSKWEVGRHKGYPLIWGEIEIQESDGTGSLNFSDSTPNAEGIVIAYNLETSVFGPGTIVPIKDVEEHGI